MTREAAVIITEEEEDDREIEERAFIFKLHVVITEQSGVINWTATGMVKMRSDRKWMMVVMMRWLLHIRNREKRNYVFKGKQAHLRPQTTK